MGINQYASLKNIEIVQKFDMQKVREMQNLKWSEDAIQQAIIFE